MKVKQASDASQPEKQDEDCLKKTVFGYNETKGPWVQTCVMTVSTFV